MEYIYERVITEGTTGYVECRPAAPLSLQEAGLLLSERPRDTFLRKYALKLLLQEPDLSIFCTQANMSRSPIFASLLLQALTIRQEDPNPELRRIVETESALPSFPAVPEGSRIFWQNITCHTEIIEEPASCAQSARIEKECALMAKRRGKLASLYAQAAHRPCEPGFSDQDTLKAAQAALEKSGLVVGVEMRHEESLSPIALLRSWELEAGVASGRNRHSLKGTSTAYGRGLKLVHARIGCLMEIIERASAHRLLDPEELEYGTFAQIEHKYGSALDPELIGGKAGAGLYWLEGADAAGNKVMAPAQAAYLFSNLDEESIFEHLGSTGLGAGMTDAQAKLAGLLEVIERDSHATMPFMPERCFELASGDPIISGLLADYRWRGIRIQFQDITTELGVPCYRCFVYDRDGRVAQATAASLSGARAALAALTETPWPYSWEHPVRAPSGEGLPDLPGYLLGGLPDYSLAVAEDSLALLEDTLTACGLMPVYVNLTRQDMGIPVYRAFIPGLETDAEMEKGPSMRFKAHLHSEAGLARGIRARKNE